MTPTLPFTDLPPPAPTPNRARTNEDWQREDPTTYEAIVERILGLDLNISALAREFAPQRRLGSGQQGVAEDTLRRAIHVMIVNDPRLGIQKFSELKKARLEILEGELIDKTGELAAKAHKADHLGAAAMAMKLTRDTSNAQGGPPVQVIRHEHTLTLDSDTLRRREELRQRLTTSEKPVIDLAAEVLPQEGNDQEHPTGGV